MYSKKKEIIFKIGSRRVGGNNPVFIIAELSANHNQDFKVAVKTIKAIKQAGADAVKLQTYTPDTLTLNCNNKYFKIKHGTLWEGKILYQLYHQAYTPWQWQPKLKRIAEDFGLICFSTPFDKSAVDFLEKMHVPAYKIASFEITDIPLIEYIASKNKPVIISTGIASRLDIKEAVRACKKMKNSRIILLKCTSAYPALPEEANLRMIPRLKTDFGCLVGLSDHTLSVSLPAAAVALGAKMIEKHFILDRKLGGPDAVFSLEPESFKRMVQSIRETEMALGKPDYSLTPEAKKNSLFRRSLFAVKDIKRGEKFTEVNLRSIRPGFGLAPKYLKNILGKSAKKNIKKGTPLNWGAVS